MRESKMKKLSIIIFSLFITININAGAAEKIPPIKYLLSINYSAGIDGKQRYLKWVKRNVSTLKSYKEVQSIVSYDNYYGTNPHRLVEFNFLDTQSAAKYWNYPKVHKILQSLPNHSSVSTVNVFIKRGDYNNKEIQK